MIVRNTWIIIPVMALLLITGCKKHDIMENIPALDEVSGIWVAADTVAMEPSLRNFRGTALVNRDFTSLSWFVSAPFTGGYHTGVMKINGKVPMAEMFRWFPYQTLRKGTADELEILSATRMIPDDNGFMWRIEITNQSDSSRTIDLDLDMIGFISRYEGDWQWWYPYPGMKGRTNVRDEEVETVRKNIGKSDAGAEVVIDKLVEGKPTHEKMKINLTSDEDIMNCPKYSARIENDNLIIADSETNVVTGFRLKLKPDSMTSLNSGGRAAWKLQMAPGEKKTIEYCMVYGDNADAVQKKLSDWTGSFDPIFENVQQVWEEKWQQIFTPDNPVISGAVPVLETDDKLAKKVYYTGPLTMLYLMHTNLPQHKRVYLTGGPKWGASITFFWDITEWSTFVAVADPDMLKEQIKSWININPDKYYGKDNFGGNGVGNGYSANYWALFQLIRSYITVSGDYDFLNETINDRTVLETLEHYATNGERMAMYGKPGFTDELYKLADFGDDEWNLLECVPTYKHIVPSFNAGYLWMLRETAEFYKYVGKSEKAEELIKRADEKLPLLLRLYAGNGVWNSLYPGNKVIEVRHCLDFMFMGRYLPEDIPDTIRSEMMDFLYRELITDHWMRAQSLSDSAAKNSDRPDHGPLGAYDGWPAGTMDALVQMGFPEKALDFYHAIEPVTYEGSWAQAHELWGENKENKKARVRIAERGWHARDAVAGVPMSQVMLKCFFGFYPTIGGDPLKNYKPSGFKGKLYHVKYHGEYYTLTVENDNPTMVKENK